MSQSVTPENQYLTLVEQGEITHDQSQFSAIQSIQLLYEKIIQPQARKSLFNVLSRNKPIIPQGLYLTGGVGTGKTMLMDIFCHSLPEKSAHRIHFHRFMQSVHEQKHNIKNEQNPLDIIAKNLSSEYRLLCLDEFAVTDITDAMILSGLLDSLFSNGLILVTTSNAMPDDLYLNGLQRQRFLPAIELIKAHTKTIVVDSGHDYRMEYLQTDSLYHVPVNENTTLELRNCYDHLSTHSSIEVKEIMVNGRAIPVINSQSDICWFDFETLCNSHRSKHDYIELSRQFHTIILQGIPVMDLYMDDAARRFIELIDELYDRGVNLIVSAEVMPDQLYKGKRLAEPFKRTISRLKEMSSNEYLARPHLP